MKLIIVSLCKIQTFRYLQLRNHFCLFEILKGVSLHQYFNK